MIDFDSCLLYLLSSDGETLTPTAPVGNHPQDADVKARAEKRHAIAGQAARSGDTIYAAEPSVPLQKAHMAAASDAHEMLMAAPMHFDHQVIGVIVLSRLSELFDMSGSASVAWACALVRTVPPAVAVALRRSVTAPPR